MEGAMQRGKAAISLFCALTFCLASLPGLAQEADDNPAINAIMAARAVKAYTDEAVSAEDLETILAAGAKAPSAMNKQPWHFTVITDADTLAEAMRTPGGALIVISGTTDTSAGMNVDFDCGLAAQNMYIAAQALGLGANLLSSPVSTLEGMRDAIGIPEGYRVIAALAVGHYDADAVSGATERLDVGEVTNYAP